MKLPKSVLCLSATLGIYTGANAQAIRSGFNQNTFSSNDDSSVLANLGFNVLISGRNFNQTFLNNNGNITFGQRLSQFTPSALRNSSTPIIAPYFADVDTRDGGTVNYGTGRVNGRQAWAATWRNVGVFGGTIDDKRNTFQVVLVNRDDVSPGNADIEFNYRTLQWEAGSASGGTNGLGGQSARAGYSEGEGPGGNFSEIRGSGQNGAFLDSNPDGLAQSQEEGQPTGRRSLTLREGDITSTEEELEPTGPSESSSPEFIVITHISDGTPFSSTANVSNSAFEAALNAARPDSQLTQNSQSFAGGVIMADIRTFEFNGVDGDVYQLPLAFNVPVGDTGYIANLQVPLAYVTLGDAKAYTLGTQGSVPFTILNRDKMKWVLTPSLGVVSTLDEDFAEASTLFGTGISSSFSYDFDKFYVTVGNQISNYFITQDAIPGFVDNSSDQQILKNGVKLSVPIPSTPWEVEGYVIHTAFLQEAPLDNYFTPGLQVSYVLDESREMKISARLESDLGSDYEAIGLRIGGGFKF